MAAGTDKMPECGGARRRELSGRAMALGFALLAAVVWGGALWNGFVWDDEYFVVSNAAIRSWANLPRFFWDVATTAGAAGAEDFAIFRPLRNISYLVDFQIAGLNPGWWHAVNIALHTANALLVMMLARRLLGNFFAAAVAGALFLVHPVQSEVVVWVKCRDDLLAVFFVLLFFLKWLGWRSDRMDWQRRAALGALYLAACLAKEQAVILPAILLILERWPSADPTPRRPAAGAQWLLYVQLAAVGAFFLAWRHWFIGHTAQTAYLAGSFGATMLTMLRAAARYVGLIFFPWKLLADYSGMEASNSLTDPRVWVAAAVLALLGGLAVTGRRRAPVAVFGLVWAGVFLLPMSNVVPMMQYMAERFLYLPMAGIALAAGALAGGLYTRRARAAVAVAGLLVAAGGVRSAARVPQWRDSLTLFAVTVRDAEPAAVRPRRNLLIQLINRGAFGEALPLARELWAMGEGDRTATARDRAERARHLGYVLLRGGQAGEGLQWIRRALEIDPDYFQPCLDFGVVDGLAGRHVEALGWFDRAAKRAPADRGVHLNRGIALRELGRRQEAEDAFHQSIECGSRDAVAYRELAAMLWADGRRREVADVCRAAMRLFPGEKDFAEWARASAR